MNPEHAECPLHHATRLLGDRWTLLILRDIMFDGTRCFRELQRQSPEGISTNILTARLKRMVAEGLLSQAAEPDEQGRKPYALTERSIALVPIMAELGLWGLGETPSRRDIRTRLFVGGGPKLWRAMQDELRAEHLHGQEVDLSIRTKLWEAESDVINGMGPLVAPPIDTAA